MVRWGYLFALADRLTHMQLSDNHRRKNSHLPLSTPANEQIALPRNLRTLRSPPYNQTIIVEAYDDRH
jgi:sugar phosphate isomerase/epimerase